MTGVTSKITQRVMDNDDKYNFFFQRFKHHKAVLKNLLQEVHQFIYNPNEDQKILWQTAFIKTSPKTPDPGKFVSKNTKVLDQQIQEFQAVFRKTYYPMLKRQNGDSDEAIHSLPPVWNVFNIRNNNDIYHKVQHIHKLNTVILPYLCNKVADRDNEIRSSLASVKKVSESAAKVSKVRKSLLHEVWPKIASNV